MPGTAKTRARAGKRDGPHRPDRRAGGVSTGDRREGTNGWKGHTVTADLRASVRTWLYRIATSRCLNALRASSRRVAMDGPQSWPDPPEPTRLGDVPWLEPYPDLLLDQLAGPEPGPEARFEATEAISLAFVTALQLLPPRQRAVIVLGDVLLIQDRTPPFAPGTGSPFVRLPKGTPVSV
jgi:hypothetical protein